MVVDPAVYVRSSGSKRPPSFPSRTRPLAEEFDEHKGEFFLSFVNVEEYILKKTFRSSSRKNRETNKEKVYHNFLIKASYCHLKTCLLMHSPWVPNGKYRPNYRQIDFEESRAAAVVVSATIAAYMLAACSGT